MATWDETGEKCGFITWLKAYFPEQAAGESQPDLFTTLDDLIVFGLLDHNDIGAAAMYWGVEVIP